MTVVLLFFALAGQAGGEETLVPVAAWGAPGAAGNRWSSELYLTNVTGSVMEVTLLKVLPLRVVEGPHPCLPPQTPISIPAHRTRVLLAWELGRYLGCPESFVGGLVLAHPPGLLVQSRMTNTKSFQGSVEEKPLQGFSQEIPGIELSELPNREGRYMIASLAWSPKPCPDQPIFDVYLYFANPGEVPVTVRLLPPEGETLRLRVPVEEVALPWEVKVPAGKVVQVAIKPVEPEGEGCVGAEFFDLFFEADGQVGVLASVVDRASNDARTVLVTDRWRLLP